MRRIGVLMPLAEDAPEQMARFAGLRAALEQLGWSDGRNVRFEYLSAGGGTDQYGALAKKLAALHPDVIFVQSTPIAAAVQRETNSIPIVFVSVSDPIGSGFVASLARPVGNLTGLLLFEAGIVGKWLSMLKEMAPRLKRIALVADPKATPYEYYMRAAETVAPSIAVEMVSGRVENAADIEHAVETLARSSDGGLVIPADPTMQRNRDLIIDLAARYRLPAVYYDRAFVKAGGLMSYGLADPIEPYRQASSYIDRILRGEKAADMPVQARVDRSNGVPVILPEGPCR